MREQNWSPEIWIETLVNKLICLEPGKEYNVHDLILSTEGKSQAFLYLEKISLIKDTKERYIIDEENEENDSKLYNFILSKAPSIKIMNKNKFKVKDSQFYNALNDGQRALLYISNNSSIKYPYRDIRIPSRFKTPEFFIYSDAYFSNSYGPNFFNLSERGIQMIIKINSLISSLCSGEIELSEAIDQVRDQEIRTIQNNGVKTVAFNEKKE